jgi:streptogramin lyase
MPTFHAIGEFNSVRNTFNTTATVVRVIDPNNGSAQDILLEPGGLALDPSGRQLWVAGNNPTVNGGFGAVGRLITQTQTNLVWYFAPAGSGPYGVVIVNTPKGTETWVSHATAGNAGRLQFNANGQLLGRETTPLAATARSFGITQAPDSHIWIADSGRNLLIELAPPYIYKLYWAFITN